MKKEKKEEDSLKERDLVARVSKKTGFHKEDVSDILRGTFSAILEALEEKKEVRINRFGRFYLKTRPPRIVPFNPYKKDFRKKELPERQTVEFVFYQAVKRHFKYTLNPFFKK